jgi:F0F1-type ATP synthase membrane subunit b/b'
MADLQTGDSDPFGSFLRVAGFVFGLLSLLVSAFFSWRNSNKAGDDRMSELTNRVVRLETKQEVLKEAFDEIKRILEDTRRRIWGSDRSNDRDVSSGRREPPRHQDD